MRKTSHDGGDSTSITSGVENEVKKSAMKPKKSSLKRKAPIFSNDSDDTVVEPLLQIDKQKTETTPSAKYIVKGKTASLQNKEIDNNTKTTTMTGLCGTTESLLSLKDSEVAKTTSDVPIHNYMNTNVFNSYDNSKINITTKSQMLVEIDENKQSGYNPSPLIFTTAKIHTDEKSKNMEPVQVTPVPILSTIEVSVSKGGNVVTTNEKKISNGSSVINPGYPLIPLNKDKEDKIIAGPSKVLTSYVTDKDSLSKISITSANRLSNNSLVQSSSTENSIPFTTSTSITTTSNTKDKQASLSDIQKEKEKTTQPILKTFNLDSIKNNVSIKTTVPSSGKVDLVDITTKSTKNNRADKAPINRLDEKFENKTSKNVNGNESQHYATPNFSKNFSNTTGSKKLQRQKTTTEETTDIKSNTESSKDSSVKTESTSCPKVKGSDKPSQINTNNLQQLNKEKPAATTTNFSNTTTTSTNISSKSVTASSAIFGKTSKAPSTNVSSNISKTSTVTSVTTGSTAITKSSEAIVGKSSVIPKSTSTEKGPHNTSMLPASAKPVKPTSVTTATAVKTTSVTSALNKVPSMTAIKPSTSLASTTTTAINQLSLTKTPSVTTSIKSPSVLSNIAANSKPSTSQVIAHAKHSTTSVGLSTSIKSPTATTSTLKTTAITPVSSKTTASQNITSVQGSTNKRLMTTASTNSMTKTPTVGLSGKPSTENSSNVTTAAVKSPNNNSSQISVTSKPSTTIAKTSPSITKASVVSSSSAVATTSTIKSPQTRKDASLTSAKKPIVTKTQAVTTKSPPVSSVNNSIVGGTTKVPSSVVASVTMATDKQSDGTSGLTKTPSGTTSTKTSSFPTSTKTSAGTSVSSISATATKPTATNTAQVSTNKPVGITGSSVPSSAPVLRPSESVNIKGGSKSSDNNKDGKVSKA